MTTPTPTDSSYIQALLGGATQHPTWALFTHLDLDNDDPQQAVSASQLSTQLTQLLHAKQVETTRLQDQLTHLIQFYDACGFTSITEFTTVIFQHHIDSERVHKQLRARFEETAQAHSSDDDQSDTSYMFKYSKRCIIPKLTIDDNLDNNEEDDHHYLYTLEVHELDYGPFLAWELRAQNDHTKIVMLRDVEHEEGVAGGIVSDNQFTRSLLLMLATPLEGLCDNVYGSSQQYRASFLECLCKVAD